MSEDFRDAELTCQTCNETFVWKSGEQKFLQKLVDEGRENRDGSPIQFCTPKRCPACRAEKKRRMQERNGR